MREDLTRNGFLEKTDREPCDFYIINSCTVTQKADKETRNLIRHFHRINPEGKIAIVGCYAELDKDRSFLENIPGVTHLVRNDKKREIAKLLVLNSKFQITNHEQIPNYKLKITNFKNRNRAFIKVQDGCNHRCSYCKVSLVRGHSRSRSTEEIRSEAEHLVTAGFKEIVLTGICLGAWGRDGKMVMLTELIKEISAIPRRFRIRLSSIEPLYVTEDIVTLMKNEEKLCKHLHMPLQSGDDRILKLMNRPYTVKGFRQIIKRIREAIPDAAITTDVLLGFPGEDDRSFRKTLKFIEDIRPSRMHVFPYSKREGTLAAKLEDGLGEKELAGRVKIVTEFGRKLSLEFAKRFIGKNENVIIEDTRHKTTGLLTGYTDRYIRVSGEGPDKIKNELVPVKITNVDRDGNTAFARFNACPDIDNAIII